MNRKSTRKSIAALLLGTLAIFGLAACSKDSEKSTQVLELEKRGFSDITAQTDGAEWGAYYVKVGECRLKVEWDKKTGYKLVEKSSQGERNDLTVEEPSLVKLKQLSPLAYCFEEPTTVSQAPPSE